MSKLLNVIGIVSFLIIVFPLITLGLDLIQLARATEAYKSGESYARSLGSQALPSQNNLSNVPQFKGDNPPQVQLQDQNIADAVKRQLANDESAKVVTETYNERGKFKLDLKRDPLMVQSAKAVANPLQTIAGQDAREREVRPQTGSPQTFTCEEGGEPAEYICTSNLVVDVKVTPATYKITTWCPEHGHGNSQIACLISTTRSCWYYSGWTRVLDQPEKIDITEKWVSNCQVLEEQLEKGLCTYVKKQCTQGQATRSINNQAVSKDCWQETFTYACDHPARNDCESLKARGCHQVASTCKQKVGNTCVLWQQTYQCESSTRQASGTSITGQGTPFCIDGNCTSQTYEANDEMLDAIAKLSIFKEMQNDLKGGIGYIFKGSDRRCRRNCIDFKDCCNSLKGWGISAGIAGCSADEKLLAQQKDKKLCHLVGTYCDQKRLGVCITKKTSYCCFPSKLSRLIHEQGRPQLGIDWGQPNQPQCRGLSVEELSRIDFSKLNLTELYQEVMANYKAPDLTKLQQSVSERLDQMQTSLKGAKSPQALPDHLRKTNKEGL